MRCAMGAWQEKHCFFVDSLSTSSCEVTAGVYERVKILPASCKVVAVKGTRVVPPSQPDLKHPPPLPPATNRRDT